ncbi:MAG: hypothetical protein LUF04_04755 [Bacteroides sp.]|nr:hypothetical protein [Bacteroides sp.]
MDKFAKYSVCKVSDMPQARQIAVQGKKAQGTGPPVHNFSYLLSDAHKPLSFPRMSLPGYNKG